MFRQIKLLTAIQLNNLFGINVYRNTHDRKQKHRWLGLAAMWVFVSLIMLFYILALCIGLASIGLAKIIPEYLFTIAGICILFFSLFKAGSVIFSMGSYQQLISMPVTNSAIVISRFAFMYITDALVSLFIMIPGIVIYGIFEQPGPLFYIFSLIGTIFLPLIPITLATGFGAIVTGISSRMKHKSIVYAVLSILLVLALFAASAIFSSNPGSITISSIKDYALVISNQLHGIYPPSAWFFFATVDENPLYLLLLIAASAALFGIMVFFVQRYFSRICTALSATYAKNNYKMEELESATPVKAMFRREMKRYFASGIYVTNTAMGYILMAVASVALFIFGTDKLDMYFGISGISTKLLPLILGAASAIMSTTACSISMEGKQWWISQTLPVRGKDILNSKILVNLAVALPFYIISVVFGIAATGIAPLNIIWIIIIPALYILFVSVAGLTVNLALPHLHWDNETQVVKQSASTLVAMLVGFASLIPPIALVFAFPACSDLILTVTAALLAILTVLLYLHNNRFKLIKIQ